MNENLKRELEKMTDEELIEKASYSVRAILGMPVDSVDDKMVFSIQALSEYTWRKLQRIAATETDEEYKARACVEVGQQGL